MDNQCIQEVQSKFSAQEELRILDAETFEIEDFSDLNQDAALNAVCSCSCSSTSSGTGACCSCAVTQ